MTQAPTPGPLSGDDVKLLVKGDLVGAGELIGTLKGVADGWGCATIVAPNGAEFSRILYKGFAFIGRPDADGWMPWSGGENPVPGVRVEVRYREKGQAVAVSGDEGALDWSRDGDPYDIIAFRLAPTAPVEASGSERDEKLRRAYEESAPFLEIIPDSTVEGCHRTDAHNPSRPQPSGETQERARSVERIKGWLDRNPEGGAEPIHPDDLRALIRPTPVASGGQHSGATDFPPENVLACADDTTPARAEAQDEGAAGKIKPCPFCGGPGKMIETMGDWAGKGKGVDGGYYGPSGRRIVCAALYEDPIRPCPGRASPETETEAISAWNSRAHPSPTPAADADRVREAIADVISHESDWRTALTAMDAAEETPEDGSGKPGYWLHQIKVLDRILAALKSTAAKEGGE